MELNEIWWWKAMEHLGQKNNMKTFICMRQLYSMSYLCGFSLYECVCANVYCPRFEKPYKLFNYQLNAKTQSFVNVADDANTCNSFDKKNVNFLCNVTDNSALHISICYFHIMDFLFVFLHARSHDMNKMKNS